jgi:hemolysin-activating ACP:hemolysin acyltransferase
LNPVSRSIKKLNLILNDEIKKNINLKNLSTQKNNNKKNEDKIWYVNIIKEYGTVKKSILKSILNKIIRNKKNENQIKKKMKDKIEKKKFYFINKLK